MGFFVDTGQKTFFLEHFPPPQLPSKLTTQSKFQSVTFPPILRFPGHFRYRTPFAGSRQTSNRARGDLHAPSLFTPWTKTAGLKLAKNSHFRPVQ